MDLPKRYLHLSSVPGHCPQPAHTINTSSNLAACFYGVLDADPWLCIRLLQLHWNRLRGPQKKATNMISLPVLLQEWINQQQLGRCEPASMQRGTYKAPEHTHTPHSSRGAFYLPGPSQCIARGSCRVIDPHTIHKQRQIFIDRLYNPFFLDLRCWFLPYFNVVLQTFLW